MGDNVEDILVPIHDEDLPKLAEIYKKHVDTIPHIYSTINTLIKWKKSESVNNLINIYSPNSCWEQDGTFIILMEFACYDMLIFTLDKSCKALLEGLLQTKRINFNRHCLFYCLHFDHYCTILELIKEKKVKLLFDIPCDLYCIPKEKALKFTYECPSDVYIKPLDKSSAPLVNSLWPHRYENSENYLATLIELNGAYGLYLKSNNELIAWVLKTPMGQLGMLQIVEAYKKKGYGSLLTKLMSKEIAEAGHEPLGTVIVDNLSSQIMFKKLSFKSLGFYTFVGIKPY